jgi:hypothetical protein
MAVKRGWAERNRSLMVRFLKAALRPNRWLFANKEPAIDFLAKEIKITPEFARKGWDYYISNRIWHPNAELNLEGMKFALEILAEQTKVAPPDRLRYVDHVSATNNQRIRRAVKLPEEEGNSKHEQTAVDAGVPVMNSRVGDMMKAPLSRQSGALRNKEVKP